MNFTDVTASPRADAAFGSAEAGREQLHVPVTERQGRMPSPEPGLTPVTTVTQNTTRAMPRDL